jgi:hypothetical protein
MELHHSKHHQTYVNGLNTALDTAAEAQSRGDYTTATAQAPLINFHGGGHLNHSLFWENLAPSNKGGGGEPQGSLMVRVKAMPIISPPVQSVLSKLSPGRDQRGLWLFRCPQEADEHCSRRNPRQRVGLAC